MPVNKNIVLPKGATLISEEQEEQIVLPKGATLISGAEQKKKEPSPSELAVRGFSALFPGITKTLLRGTEVGVSATPSTGSEKSLLKGDFIKPETIESYNKNFEDMTGYSDFSLSEPERPSTLIGQERYQKKKQSADERKYEKYKIIEDLEINPVISSIQRGQTNPKKLSELYDKPYGKKVVGKWINQIAPEVGSMALESDVFGNEKKWEEISKAIDVKNRPEGVKQLNDYLFNLDNEVYNSLKNYNLQTVSSQPNRQTGTKTIYATNPFPEIDTNNSEELGEVLEQLSGNVRITDKDGNIVEGGKEKLINEIKEKLFYLKTQEPIPGEISSLSPKIQEAVLRVNMAREAGEQIDPLKFAQEDKINQQHFQLGLNYVKDADPGMYKNIVRALNDKGQIADINFRYVSRIGQDIRNEQLFREGATNPEAIGAETDFDYMTYQDKKSLYASQIGEYLKEQGFNNVRQFTPNQIKDAARNLRLPNQAIVNDLATEEQILGYDAIPKTGWREAVYRGMAKPISGIKSTFEKIGETPSETYLKTQQYDVGTAQKIPGKEGQMTDRLGSDRGNLWYDALEGFGQFIPQVLLTRGIGSPMASLAKGAASTIPRGTLTAAQSSNIVNYGGTLASVYLQEYGNAYEDALQKTGDPKTARAMGAINGIAAAGFELILPDTKIADRAARIFNKGYANDILDLLKKGGDPSAIARKGKPIIQKFVGETLGITKQEVKEEMATNIANYITESIFSPKTAAERDLGGELIETAKATAVSMLIPAVLGGAGSSVNKNFTVNGLHAAAINFQSYKDAMQAALINDQIDQTQYNLGVKLLSTHRQSIQEAPVESSEGKRLSQSERLEYAYQDTLIKSLDEQLKQASGEVTKEDIKNKIKKSQDIQREILIPDRMAKEKKAPTERTENIDESWRNRVVSLETEMQKDEIVEVKDKEPSDDLLTEIKSNETVSQIEQGEDLQYFIDKAGEDPIAFMERFGEDMTAKLLKEVPTDKLVANRDFLVKNFGEESDTVQYLNEVIQSRGGQTKPTPASEGEESTVLSMGDEISVGEMVDKTGTYKGEKGSFYQDGQAVVFKVEGKNKEYELGNIDEIKGAPISDFDITHEESVVSIDDNGDIKVREQAYKNNYSNPLAAINKDDNGNVVSVNLETFDGKKRTFRGNIAEDIAYQINLKEINKNNETRTEFEQHLNEDATASKEMDNGTILETSKKEPIKDNEPVSRQKVKPKQKSVAKEQPKAETQANETATIQEATQSPQSKPTIQEGQATEGIAEPPSPPTEGEAGGRQENLEESGKTVNLGQTSKDANDIITGKKVFERFSQEEQRGFAEGGSNHVEASILLAGSESTSGKDNTTPETQENSIEAYAKEKGIWTENTTESLTSKYGEPIAAGEEAIVWFDPNTGKVIKTQDTFQYDNLQQKLDGITLHNSYFPESPIKVLGFGRNSNGDFQVIVEQPFIKGEKLTPSEIKNHLESIGFKEDENGNFSNDDTIIEDVHTGNAIKTPEGNIVVIDPIMRLNTPEQGYGGKRRIEAQGTEKGVAEPSVSIFDAIGQRTKLKPSSKKDIDSVYGEGMAERALFINKHFNQIAEQLKNKICP